MKKNKRVVALAILMLILLNLCACASGSNNINSEQLTEGELGLSDTPYVPLEKEGGVIAYTKTPMRAYVMVDSYGYETFSDKVVICLGDVPSKEFELIDDNTGESVYVGRLEKNGIEEQTGLTVSYGYFSGFTQEGKYHIRTEGIGESYPFEIRSGLNSALFRDMLTCLSEIWNENLELSAEDMPRTAVSIHNLLIALEYYTQLFSDDNQLTESGNGIPDAMDMVLRLGNAIKNVDTATLNERQLASYVGITAAISQGCKILKTLKGEADGYLALSQRAYDKLLKMPATSEEEKILRFYGSVLYYRASGASIARNEAESYLETHADKVADDAYDYYGKVCYISCKSDVDRNLCSKIMSALTAQAMQLSHNSEGSSFLVSNSDLDVQCANVVRISIINYVITNHEYVKVQNDYLHFLLGRNVEAKSYIDGYGVNSADCVINNNADYVTSLILAMCEILSEQNK
ncbi:MAG: glycoside hydrolase family 9 protein [Lachnospiraceae bacterium]|nr:glycoside hydrolase family 9 protein [Candidatus Merdinaster equi]